MAERGDVRIGVSGWTYRPWRGQFYPVKLAQKRELEYAASQFNALEINGTFYGMQTPKAFSRWAASVPEGFMFAVKGPRYLTHMLKLRDVEVPLANFFASGPLAMGDRLGPILWQFPERFRFDAERIEAFFRLLPRDTGEAAALARRHDDRLKAPASFGGGPVRPLRHAMEIRHESFCDKAFIDLLRRHEVALVCADTVDWPLLMDVTADFVYCRLHGSVELYNSGYTAEELDVWAARVRNWAAGGATDGNFVTGPTGDGKRRDVFVFFDNTDKLMAPGDALGLMQRVGVGWEKGEVLSGVPALQRGDQTHGVARLQETDMATTRISNDHLTVEVSSLGAEMQSIVTADGQSWLWHGDAAFWAGRSPILFPIVGRAPEDHISVDGKRHPMGQHGFARRSEFDLVAQGDDFCRYDLTAGPTSKVVFPFAFRLELEHRVEGRGVTVTAQVTNEDHRPMPFGIGFHPAFVWPLPGSEGAEHSVQLDNGGEPKLVRLEGGLVRPERLASPFEQGRLVLDHALFREDAMLFPEGAGAGLRYAGGDKAVRLTWENLPNLALWSKPGAPFVCLEPWHGTAAEVGGSDALDERPYSVVLGPGATGRYGFRVELEG